MNPPPAIAAVAQSVASPVDASPTPHLHLDRVTLHYGARQALRATTLSIPKGAFFAIIGPSGCGKSSLLRAMNRLSDLIPGCHSDGSITLDGQDIRDPALPLIELRRRVGMVFQQPNPFPIGIAENLDLPLREHGWRRRAARRDRIEWALQEVGLLEEVKDRLRTPALRLSGGQQQRLCIARALTLDPEVLLMDEPCSALDPLSSAVVEDMILRLRGRLTVVIVTHNLGQARRLSDRTAFFWMKDGMGCLVECDDTERLFTAPARDLTSAYVNGQRG